MNNPLKLQRSTRYVIFYLCYLLTACHSSKNPELYVLNPNPLVVKYQTSQQAMLIGIDDISLPEYLDNPQLVIFKTAHQSMLLEHHQWAGPLSNNIQRVIKTNLINQLPHAAVESAPWGSDFYPQYHLRIEISQFKVDCQGNSILRAIYTIETEHKQIHQQQVQFYEKLTIVTPFTVVLSMNHLINQLSDTIAVNFKKLTGS